MLKIEAMKVKAPVLFVCIAALVTIVYSNHFGNEFHFDDYHTIVQNPYIRSIHNLPRFFVDKESTSVLPANRAWRPLVFASLAIDYWFGNAMKPFYFHLSTFIWFLVLLALMFALFRKIFEQARPNPLNIPSPLNIWMAAFATALFAVHPAVAETVNYIIQRADLYSTLGVVASLVVWISSPRMRKYGLYLLPLAAAALSKPPAMIFPAILILYIWLFEEATPAAALRRSIPSILVVAALGWLTSVMTPATYTFPAYGYRITQPIVILRYFRTFFIPTGLTADTDRNAFNSIFDADALFGFVFLAVLIAVAVRTARRRETKPIAFGLGWFLLALLPTSIFPLAEVENDHRMFFPFVGLTLSASWAMALWLHSRPARRRIPTAACGLVLLAFGAAAWQRNQVWRTEESLWYDVTLKSPHNGRGLMNYGLSQMSKGDIGRALDYFRRALVWTPNYYILEVNLGIANGVLHNDAEAERHFARAIQIQPVEAVPQYFYAIWLRGKGRTDEAVQRLNLTIANNPSYIDASHLLMEIYAQQMNADLLRRAAHETLMRFPTDPAALSWLSRAGSLTTPFKPAPESYLNASLALYQQGKFDDSIQAAREALKLRPDYWEAWNNIAAAYNSESNWDEGIRAGQQAVRLRPDSQLARNNLVWGIQQKQKSPAAKRGLL
jgi:tetratricopeptide (TPR) repeat protein